MAYDVNDAERVTFTYRNTAGTLANPTATTATITTPAGVATTYTYGVDGQLVRDSTGVFHIDVTFNAAGTWTVEGYGTGAVAAASSQTFVVGVTNAYADVDTFGDYLGPTATASAAQKQTCINVASRAIDAYCDRQFWLNPTAIARTYMPKSLYSITVDDIGTTDGLIVATDASGDGTFETVWTTGDYQLLPYNAPYDGPEPEPWTCIRAVGAHTFPWLAGTYLRRVDRIQITARWGWPAVPEAVRQATLIKAAQIFHRKNSPQGVMAFDEFGAVRVGRGEDGDVTRLLAPYRDDPILIA